MKNKLNPLAIGMFVMVATAIAVATIMIFGASKFFTHSEMAVSYFSESVNGLDTGAPVKYKGVLIGKVEKIRISSSSKNLKDNLVAVIYSIDLDALKRKTQGEILNDFDQWLDSQIREGLRAKLNYQSIVTGMLYIELDYLAQKNTKAEYNYKGIMFTEVPSAKSGLAELGKAVEKAVMNISQIDFNGIAANANNALLKINQKLDDIDAKAIGSSIQKTLDDADILLKNSNELVCDTNIKKSVENLNVLLVDARSSLKNVDKLVGKFDGMFSPQSPFRFELALMLRNLNESMSSISNFMEYLQRNPSSIITGKAQSQSEGRAAAKSASSLSTKKQ